MQLLHHDIYDDTQKDTQNDVSHGYGRGSSPVILFFSIESSKCDDKGVLPYLWHTDAGHVSVGIDGAGCRTNPLTNDRNSHSSTNTVGLPFQPPLVSDLIQQQQDPILPTQSQSQLRHRKSQEEHTEQGLLSQGHPVCFESGSHMEPFILSQSSVGYSSTSADAVFPSISTSTSTPTTSTASTVSSLSFSSPSHPVPHSNSFSNLSPPYPTLASPLPTQYTHWHTTPPDLFSLPIDSTTSTSLSPPQLSVPQVPVSIVGPTPILLRSSSLLSSAFTSTLNLPSQHTISFTGESTTGATLCCAYSQPFSSIPFIDLIQPSYSGSGDISSSSLLRAIASLSTQPKIDNKMGRKRSQSTSSMGNMPKSPTSLMASLSTSVALYDNQEPPKTLQDILLLAQSHYISHRYVPALTLYKLAAERHHSLPACCSLYALYTSTLNVPGLVRSDTKATQILIHALRIWTARRWSSSRLVDKGAKRSEDHDEFDELEEYFAQPRRPTRSHRRVASNNTATVSIQKRTKPRPSQMKDVAASMESEYRTPLHLANLDDANRIRAHVEASEIECESDDCSEHDEDDDTNSCDSCEDCGGWDDGSEDEDEKDEEARRIGLATAEIEDIVQKICSMIQKGVLGLDEPVLVKAVSTLRIIERGLSKEAEAWKQELSRSRSMFSLNEPNESVDSTKPDLLLTQGIDLSFLSFSPEDDNGFPVALPRPVSSHPQELRHKNSTLSTKSIFGADSKSDPANATIVGLPSGEREQDRAFCRAIRIRTMSTLGWVHQQKGEYNYGAQAYGVCSEIATTGKRPLNILQQQALVNRQTCEALLKEEAKKPVVSAEPIQIREQRRSENRSFNQSQISLLSRSSSGMPRTSAPSTSASTPTLTSATTSTLASTPTVASYSDVSSPSSIASSDSGAMSIRGPGAISSLSAAIWGSGIFKSTLAMASNSETESSKSKSGRRLSRSKSMLLESKVKGLQTAASPKEIKEAKEPQQNQHSHRHHHHHHRHPCGQDRTKLSGPDPVLTMSEHQKKVVKCGHCGQCRTLMPLCACKKIRYCNGECRLADLEAHRLTGCHAANIGVGAAEPPVTDAHPSVNIGVTI